jgi:squalene-hopene/tetraprenyl-beta-curcumene cyclase
MANTVMAFDALGFPPDHPALVTARESVERLLIVKEDEAYCQPCHSPVWDTALACHALMEVGGGEAEAAAKRGLSWLKPRQVLDVKGDWAHKRPDVRPGGWPFQYNNAHYPDLDDTAAVVMAMHRAEMKFAPAGGGEFSNAIDRGQEWIAGLQSSNGGWAAYDADNTHEYLNNIPFADHGALLDPPTADVTARCVSMFAQLGATPDQSPELKRGVDALLAEQLPDGSWFGRWGINYVYGTWSVLSALNAAGVDPQSPAIRRAVAWLESTQNADGGWGESDESYKLEYRGYEAGRSTASQTAWALLGLMAAGEADNPAVARGIRYLSITQADDGFWPEETFTGTGFPRVLYLRYHGYPKFFPLWAMARFRNLQRGNSRNVAFGM